jgi:hypothetical protein
MLAVFRKQPALLHKNFCQRSFFTRSPQSASINKLAHLDQIALHRNQTKQPISVCHISGHRIKFQRLSWETIISLMRANHGQSVLISG